jgi:hypothetical protein
MALGALRKLAGFNSAATKRYTGSYDAPGQTPFIGKGMNDIYAGGFVGESGGHSTLVYPLTLRDNPERPVVRFTCFPDNTVGQQLHMYFPTPPGLTFSDGASYNNFNLGALTATAGKALRAGADAYNAGNNDVAAAQAALSAASNVINNATTLRGREALQLGLSTLGIGEDLRGASALETGVVVNPNTKTGFGGNTVRQFGFEFKMVARSAHEAAVVDNIQSLFRNYLYAEAVQGKETLLLTYPPIWNIRFLLMGGGGIDNPMIPKIYSCFLTDVKTTINSSTQLYHHDGAPIEVDINLTFQETKALTRGEIVALRKGEIDQYGQVGKGAKPRSTESNDALKDVVTDKKVNQFSNLSEVDQENINALKKRRQDQIRSGEYLAEPSPGVEGI